MTDDIIHLFFRKLNKNREELEDSIHTMKSTQKNWQIFGFTALSSLALGLFPQTTSAIQPPSVENPNRAQIAQMNNCREVDVNTALNIRRQPGGQVIGTLEDGQNVSIMGRPQDGWVRIENPMDGYVAARYLNYCIEAGEAAPPMGQTTPTTPETQRIATLAETNCREAISPDVPIRDRPNGEVIGTLQENQVVVILNEGDQGWVPIQSPIRGYLSSANLGYCSQ